jgi:hypothetical protein
MFWRSQSRGARAPSHKSSGPPTLRSNVVRWQANFSGGTLGGVPSFIEPEAGAGDVDEGEVVAGSFVVARSDGAKAFEVVEEDLDEVAEPVELSDEAVLARALRHRVDDRTHTLGTDGLQEVIRVIAAVADESLATGVSEQLVGSRYFVALARRERDVERPALGVDDGVELG